MQKQPKEHTMPLPLDCIRSAGDNSVTEADTQKLITEYNLDVASCVGALVYLALTRTDIIHALNKLAKYTRCPGKAHFIALIHTLQYVRDHNNLGLKFYSDHSRSPVALMLKEQNVDIADNLLYSFSDLSWNDGVDSIRSTGCFLIYCMGEVVDHNSNLPDHVSLSSAKAEYTECC